MSHEEMSAARWAQQEFGAVEGDPRNVRRLVRVATRAAQRPAGTITRVFRRGGERDGAYGVLANGRVTVEALAAAQGRAAVARCRGARVAIVPVDPSSQSVTDRRRAKGTGPIGARSIPTRGFNVIMAIVMVAGVVLGVAAQTWWTRPERPRKKHRHARPFAQKESYHWVTILARVAHHFAQLAPDCRPWFQLDRGGDCYGVLEFAVAQRLLLTVRAQHDRALVGAPHGYLRRHLRTRRPAGYTTVEVPARPGRKGRTARLAVRVDPGVTFVITDRRTSRKRELTLPVVHAREVGTTPRGETPIEWFLLTTYRVRSLSGALRVLHAYARRYTIESFYNTWKSGVCGAEDTQLRAADRIQKWATILASVAARALRLTQLARQKPDLPAAQEFSPDEIDAAILLRKPRGIRVGHRPALGQLVTWIADLGGYSGKSSSGPPGKTVVARGLAQVEVAADALRTLREQQQGPPPKTPTPTRRLRRSG